MNLSDRLNENLSLWILNDENIYSNIKEILTHKGNTLQSEKIIIEYLQDIDKVCKEIGSIGIDYTVDKKFIDQLINDMEIDIK